MHLRAPVNVPVPVTACIIPVTERIPVGVHISVTTCIIPVTAGVIPVTTCILPVTTGDPAAVIIPITARGFTGVNLTINCVPEDIAVPMREGEGVGAETGARGTEET